MKYLSGKMFVGVVSMISLAALVMMSLRTYAKPAVVLSDQQLMEWARDTYERGDWIYAAVHLNALVQRNPPLLSNNSALSNQVNEGLKFSIERLQEYKANAEACAKRSANGGGGGVGSVSAGLTRQPPRIDFPH